MADAKLPPEAQSLVSGAETWEEVVARLETVEIKPASVQMLIAEVETLFALRCLHGSIFQELRRQETLGQPLDANPHDDRQRDRMYPQDGRTKPSLELWTKGETKRRARNNK